MNILLRILFLGTALAFSGPSLSAGTRPVSGEALSDDQTYTYRVDNSIGTLDPHHIEGDAVRRVLVDLFEGLTNTDQTGEPIPGAAESWTVSKDKLTYTFKIRDTVWSNGDPVTAGDFVFAWRRLADPATASEYSWYIELMGVKNAAKVVSGEMAPDALGVTALDDKTLVVKIDAPRPYFPIMVAYEATFPINKGLAEIHGDDWAQFGNLTGNGAYVLAQHILGDRLVSKRNPLYWNNGATIIEKVTALVIPDDNVALTRFLVSDIDQTSVPSGQYPVLKDKFPKITYSAPRSCTMMLILNMEEKGHEALKDVRVRQALSYAIDRNIIVNNILRAGEFPAYNLIHNKTNGYVVPEIEYANWTQSERLAMAQELLTEAGYGKGGKPLKLKLSYNTSPENKRLVIAISQMWRAALGIKTTLDKAEWPDHLDKKRNGDFDVLRYGWCADYNEPSAYLDILTSSYGDKNGGYISHEYDGLAKAAKHSSNPSQEYHQMEQLLARDIPIIPVYHYSHPIMIKPDMKGYPFDDIMARAYSRRMYRSEN
jgi:oligopeptide transport system substrate-binding protein